MKTGKKKSAKGGMKGLKLDAKHAGQVRGGATAKAQMTFQKASMMSAKKVT